MNYDHLMRAHRCRALADALEREPVPPSGEREVDIEVLALRALVVAHFRKCAELLEVWRR